MKKMFKVRLFKMDDEEAKNRGWKSLQDMAEDLGYTVEELTSWWFLDDMVDEYEEIDLPDDVSMESVEGNIVFNQRVLPSCVDVHVLVKTETVMLVAVHNVGDFL